MILLLGSEGSMGRRYQAIMNYHGVNYVGLDQHNSLTSTVTKYAKEASGIILATPTGTHMAYLQLLMPFKTPILCEKPITKNMGDWDELIDLYEDTRCPIRMMFQYSLLDSQANKGLTKYDFYNHGKDGLLWDCFQPIALARGIVEIKETSPIWTGILNGKELHSCEMDRAYVQYFKMWQKDPRQDLYSLRNMHEKVHNHGRLLDAGN